MAHIFIDESGHFGSSNSEKCFVVGSFIIGDPSKTEKGFKKWVGSKFPKKMRSQNEVKWSSTRIDLALRQKTLKHIADMDVRVRYVYLYKKNIPTQDLKHQGLLYTNIIGEVLEMYLPPIHKELFIICDQRKLPGLTQMEFKNLLKSRLQPKLPKGTRINISIVDSTSNKNIQIVDWITGALAWYHEKKPLGNEYYRMLKNNLLDEGREIFKPSEF